MSEWATTYPEVDIYESPNGYFAWLHPDECHCYRTGVVTPRIPWCLLHRCTARTRKGERCANQAHIADMCNMHFNRGLAQLLAQDG